MQYFIKRGDKTQGPFTPEQLTAFVQQGKILDSDLVGQTPDGPFFPASSIAQNPGSGPAVPNIQTTPQPPASTIPSPIQQPANTQGFAGSPAPRKTSPAPLLNFVDSLIETKEVDLPSQETKSGVEKIYEYSIYAFVISTVISMIYMIALAIAAETFEPIWIAIAIPVCLTWFVIGVWGIRKTAELVKSNQVIISTDLPVGLTNINFRVFGGLFFAAGVFLFGLLIYLSIHILVSEADSGRKLASLWSVFTLFAPIAVGCGYIGYLLWRSESTLSHLKSNSITKTNETASVSNEFLSTTIIMTKNLYAKLPMLLLTLMGVSLLVILSFTTTPLVNSMLVDGASLRMTLGIATPVVLYLIGSLSFLPLSLWMLSIGGILSVEISLAILACGRLAIKNLQS